MTIPFTYPSVPHVRCHGPIGYADQASYRPWLRDEFSFRCVYCLLREQWGRVQGVYDVEHLLPVAYHAERALDYDNLLYACATCNAAKGTREVPDPLQVFTSQNIQVREDGLLVAATSEAARLIMLLGLNGRLAVEFRLLWISIIALAAKADPALFRRLMAFPFDLPDLRLLKPPGGNLRPDGVSNSYHVRRDRGELPETY